MQGYAFLSSEDTYRVRRDRILELEAEHCRALLMIEEDPDDAAARHTANELGRRIRHHVNALTSVTDGRLHEDSGQPAEAVSKDSK